jgi:hypothetical protein
MDPAPDVAGPAAARSSIRSLRRDARMLETLGIAGLVDRWVESGSKGWWLQLLPAGLHLPASVAMAVLGGLLVLRVVVEERRRVAERR